MSGANAPAANALPQDQKGAEQRSHEPSMEEILASIRRIISDDQMLPLSPRASVPPLPPGSIGGSSASRGEPPADREPDAATASADVAPRDRGSDGPDAARDHREHEDPDDDPERRDHKGHLDHDDVLDLAAVADMEHADESSEVTHGVGPAGPHAASAPMQPALMAHEEPPMQPASAPAVAAPPHAAMVPPAAAAPPTWAAESRAEPHHEPIVSENTVSSVSSSFHQLAATMLMQNFPPVDQIARELLRPMIKTWLDDNLPVMVERLVRAEIERVARVGR